MTHRHGFVLPGSRRSAGQRQALQGSQLFSFMTSSLLLRFSPQNFWETVNGIVFEALSSLLALILKAFTLSKALPDSKATSTNQFI